MKLYYSPTSPYVRKVNVVAIETGLEPQIQRLPTNPWQADDELLRVNPLSKVPTLVTAQGRVLFDSPVICEYLDSLHDAPRLLPVSGPERWAVLTTQALADGILDASIARFLERKRPEQQRAADWDLAQQATVQRALAWLEAQHCGWGPEPDLGQIAAGCALGYLDFRFAAEDWRTAHPGLAAWFAAFARRPAMLATVPQDSRG